MEPAKIDWKKIEWNFAVDELYEHINAPKWVDFLSLDHSPLRNNNNGDEAWFCKPDCNHPKTAEDFLRSTSPSKAFPVYFSENLPCGDQNRRDAQIKRRAPVHPSSSPQDDSENQDPNLFTLPIKSMKAVFKSSEEKKKPVDDTFPDNMAVRSLRSTLSAKNLFAKRPILNQITEFCNELKKLATKVREREHAENMSPKESEEEVVVQEKTPPFQALAESDGREKERKPLLEVGKGKLLRKKRPEEAENMPITLDLENVRHKKENGLQQVRTTPPSPQCFSVTRGISKVTPSKASKSRLMEKAVLEEVEQNKEVVTKDSSSEKSRSITTISGRESKAMDMFWFFKPCTMSSY